MDRGLVQPPPATLRDRDAVTPRVRNPSRPRCHGGLNQPPPTVRETGSGSQGLKPVLERLTHEREPDERLLTGPRGGVLTTACVRDATKWDQLVTELELPSLTGHGLRHTGATWLADAGIPLHVLHGILGRKSIETTRGYLHPGTRHLADATARANAFLDGHKYPEHESPASSGLATAPRR
ncbi:tyrosine-type recombinase/integrase [Glutamicibacter protophormiae]|uniref:tyrosine-type recombinase/integrase n=1 Tax=Kocuria TaxID=57493 RepID=UPI001E49479A|nr:MULTISPECIES: tyrosine-type recombinase/integrase [Kocuria]MDN5631213.1 site-specific integrase [Kocuria sp.]WNB89955.1 tyrosine-type recombinase/integrase [Glutamicibacter protophormiae]